MGLERLPGAVAEKIQAPGPLVWRAGLRASAWTLVSASRGLPCWLVPARPSHTLDTRAMALHSRSAPGTPLYITGQGCPLPPPAKASVCTQDLLLCLVPRLTPTQSLVLPRAPTQGTSTHRSSLILTEHLHRPLLPLGTASVTSSPPGELRHLSSSSSKAPSQHLWAKLVVSGSALQTRLLQHLLLRLMCLWVWPSWATSSPRLGHPISGASLGPGPACSWLFHRAQRMSGVVAGEWPQGCLPVLPHSPLPQ